MVVVDKVVERDESGFGASRRRRHQQKPLPCARKRGGLFGPKASFLSSSQSSIILWDPNPFPPSLSRQMSHHHHQQQVRRLERFFFLSLSLSLCDSSPYVLCVVSFVAFALSERALFCDVGEMVVVRSLTRRFPIIIIIIIIIIIFCCRRLRRRVQ